jgi:hypothetical protein
MGRALKIILNSDVLLSISFEHGVLPDELRILCDFCADRGIEIVIPATTLLEFDRRRSEFVQRTVRDLQRAYDLLDRFSIGHDDVPPETAVSSPDLLALLEAAGVATEHAEPILDDYQDAHRRACSHLAPRSGGKSDEMRDLVIWALALRLARDGAGAVLVARDAIFHDERSAEEARVAGLIRVESIEEAIEVALGVKSPSERLAEPLIHAIWTELWEAGLPIPDAPVPYNIWDEEFVLGEDGNLASARMTFSVDTVDNEPMQAALLIQIQNLRINLVALQDIRINGVSWRDGELRIPTDQAAPMLEIDSLRTA